VDRQAPSEMEKRVTTAIEVDVWVRGTEHAHTRVIGSVSANPAAWTDTDVHRLLSEMLLALEREKNPGGEAPPVTLRGFSWIVSPDESRGVIVHLEMQMGTASAGPFAIDQERLSAMIERVMQQGAASERVH
jgi:hypothetical protein